MQYRTALEVSNIYKGIIDILCQNNNITLASMASSLNNLVNYDDFFASDCNSQSFFDVMACIQDIETCLKKATSFEEAIDALKANLAAMWKQAEPLKLAFVVQEFALWPSFQSIWESCPGNIEKSIVVVYSFNKTLSGEELDYYVEPYRKAGYNVRTSDDYELEVEQPDIIFYMKPYRVYRGCPESFYINKAKTITPFTVFISYCLDVQGGDRVQNFFYGLPFFYHVWRIVGYSEYYRNMMIKRGYRDANNVILLGHPKFDGSYRLTKERNFINDEWKRKINGRKVVLWNSHFSIEPNIGVGTFLRWRTTIFHYFAENRDMVLLWRPHPIFWQIISKTNEINIKEFNMLLSRLESADNVIVDRTGDYRFAFCMSDALISDATTFLVEYAATSKPILYTIKPDGETVCNDDYLVGVNIAEEEDDVLTFLDDVRLDRIEAERTQSNHENFEKIFGKCDGMVGQRILDYVLAEMENEITKKVKNRILLFEKRCEDVVE